MLMFVIFGAVLLLMLLGVSTAVTMGFASIATFLFAGGDPARLFLVPQRMFAQVSGLKPGEFIHVIADAHIYDRHVPAVEEIIKNEPKPAPKFIIDPTVDDFYKFTRDSFSMEGYEYSDFKGTIPVAV